MKSFAEFRDALGMRESSNRYHIKNKYGFVGRYQFGLPRLADFGLCRRKEGTTAWDNESFEWIAPYNEEMFLSTPSLQDLVFRIHIDDSAQRLKEFESGLAAGMHLKGWGGVQTLLFEGKAGTDAFGTSILEYIKRFSGYNLR